MPTYEYICAKCEHQFDFFQSIKDAPLSVCPKEKCPCKPWGKGKVKRAISAGAGLIFKGTGFYITDYRSEQYKEAAKKESGAGAAEKSGGTGEKTGGEKKTEAKPSAPTPSKSESAPAKSRKKET